MYNPRRNGGGPISGRLGNKIPDSRNRQQPKSIFEVVRRMQYEDPEPYNDMMPGPSYEADYNPGRSHPYYDRPMQPQSRLGPSHRQMNNGSPNKIPSLLEIQPEFQPAPLLPPESVEKLRANLRSSGYRYNEEIGEWEPEVGEPRDAAAALIEQFDVNKLVNEEKATKKKIDEIIRVAQALRDKLEKEEELRQALEAIGESPRENQYGNGVNDRYNVGPPEELPYESPNESRVDPYEIRSPRALSVRSDKPDKIPSLFDIKPSIPSLLDIYVPPPDEAQENLQMTIQNNRYERDDFEPETCWNCDRFGHGFTECGLPQQREFCFRCGNLGYDIYTCPCAPPKEYSPKPLRFGRSNFH